MEADAARQTSPDGHREQMPHRRGFIRRLISLAGPYWRTEEKWTAWALTGGLVVLTLAQVVSPILLNLWSERLFDALEQRSMRRFTLMIGALVVIIVANMVITTTHLNLKRRLQLGWRRWVTRKILDEWMAAGRHYQITNMAGDHDNPDGRVAEDVRIATEYAIDLAHSLFYCLLLLVSFTKILWSLSGPGEFIFFDTPVSIPGHLVWVALVYAIVGTSVALLLGRPLVRAVNSRQTMEANFRFGLVHARENSEAIALIHGEVDERRRFTNLFTTVAEAWKRQTTALIHIFMFTSSYSVLSTAFPIIIAAPRYIGGVITLGVLMQTAQAFQQMEAALSWPIDNLSKVAEWKASVERVLGLHSALSHLEETMSAAHRQAITVEPADRPALVFQNLSVTNPDGHAVISDFNAEIAPGERVLISGDPGAAVKLFKVVAGLWPWGQGRVQLPSDASIFFMPQRPYLPIGRLRSAVSYPASPETFDDVQLTAALSAVDLEHLAARLETPETWEKVLTAGEQQRLGFARLLLHRPNWIFIQEATDALDPEGEEDMMRLVQAEFPLATVLTVGYHTSLEAYHHRKLVLVRSADGLVLIEDRRKIERPDDKRKKPRQLYDQFIKMLRSGNAETLEAKTEDKGAGVS